VAIHDYVNEEFSAMEQDEITAEASKRIIGTNILFGMMLSILMSHHPNLNLLHCNSTSLEGESSQSKIAPTLHFTMQMG
jgi:hypothetical protein